MEVKIMNVLIKINKKIIKIALPLLVFSSISIYSPVFAYIVTTKPDGRNVYTFTSTESIELYGKIKIECYGAKGGNCSYPSMGKGYGGNGGKASGELELRNRERLFVTVNYGAGSRSPYSSAGNGGGASDVRRGGNTLNDRIIVAGGGGGGGEIGDNLAGNGGVGGGLNGGNGADAFQSGYYGTGGGQTYGGYYGGSFGQGGNAGGCMSGGGGGGWYGGGAGSSPGYSGHGGGGGSSYIGGVFNGSTEAGVSTTAKVVITVLNYYPVLSLSSPQDGQVYSENQSNNQITISGTVIDENIGDNLLVKYTIDGVAQHTNITIANLTSNNTNQPFNHTVLINNSIPEGSHTLRVWAEDNYGGRTDDTTRSFFVEKAVGDPSFRTVTSENRSFNVEGSTGNYSDNTNNFINNNTGSNKPFYLKTYNYKFGGSQNTFYDFGSTMTYIGDNLFRVVTSEGKAFNVDKDNGLYTDVTNLFLTNNLGQGKPFYHHIYEQEINGYGPYIFHDFGTTMAYIGNNKLRVVTSEGKAFDVDKDTGAYTDVTATFLVNNFGPGKPFYLREYTHNIGGEAKTFYDWGSSMAYIGNDTLRVITSEGKAFNVNINDGTYADITGIFLINNFGAGKPFCHRTYTVTINGIDYTFNDWGCTMAYTLDLNPQLTITSPSTQTAFDKATLTGTVTDTVSGTVTVSAILNGIEKSVVVDNTTTPQPWTLEWDIVIDNIPDGSYTNIVVTADNSGGGTSTLTYTGNINVYGPGTGLTKKTINYEYDSDGKLLRRYIIY